MCGLAGFLDLSGALPAEEMRVRAARMARTLIHRGPDDAGEWVDAETGVALGHRRLAILDLSPNGHQPMRSHCGRYAIAFNGEIYNHRDLRADVEKSGLAPSWRGHSDTEVLLEAIARLGLRATLERTAGMFAFALWDRDEQTLHLARDRLGEKPLYYGWADRTLLFGSELKALRAHPVWRGEVDRDALALYLRHSYVPTPRSIYLGIYKLQAGTIASVSLAEARRSPGIRLRVEAYWSLREIAQHAVQEPFRGSIEDASRRLEELLRDVIREQMLADVPVGAFLSGGIDSSTVVALMQQESARRVRTFTIGFHERGYDEAVFARRVAQHLRTDHTELYVTAREALEVVPRLPEIYDEPFADPSQIPTFLVSKLARGQVTVCLSGDGGDELFGGYPRYPLGLRIWPWMRAMPFALRRGLAHATSSIAAPVVSCAQRALALLSIGTLDLRVGDKLGRLADMLALERPETFYRTLMSHWRAPADVVRGASASINELYDPEQWLVVDDFAQRMMFLDAVTYLPDDILTKVDRAAMASSLESRMPILDRRVVEFAWSLPREMKFARGEGKRLLRQILHRHVPRDLVDRPKMGFGVPIDAWLRGPLRDWAETLLAERRLDEEGFLAPALVRRKWLEHLSGRRDWRYLLWDVLMFQGWLEEERRQRSNAEVEGIV